MCVPLAVGDWGGINKGRTPLNKVGTTFDISYDKHQTIKLSNTSQIGKSIMELQFTRFIFLDDNLKKNVCKVKSNQALFNGLIPRRLVVTNRLPLTEKKTFFHK